MSSDICSIVLAAGSNSRMPPDERPKICCKVDGKSILRRLLNTMANSGISRHVIVVSPECHETVKEADPEDFGECSFVVQPKPNGTGEAVRRGLNGLPRGTNTVFICVGDKSIRCPKVIQDYLTWYRRSSYENLAIFAGPSDQNPDSGRILFHGDSERVKAVVEVSEIIKNPEGSFSYLGEAIKNTDARNCKWSNLSLYAGKADLLLYAVGLLQPNNVKREFYFTDVVYLLSRTGFLVGGYRNPNWRDVMGFNNIEELERIRYEHKAQCADSSL